MASHDMSSIRVARPLGVRLRGALLALRGKDVLFDQGTQVVKGGQRRTLAKLSVALWCVTDDPLEAHVALALMIEQIIGRAEWDESLEPAVAARRDDAK